MAAAKICLEWGIGKPGPAEPARTGRGLVIVLSSQDDPLAARSRPTKPIDLTMSGPVVDAEPAVSRRAGARAKSPALATAKKALPPGPAAATAAALAEQARKGKQQPKLPRALRDSDGDDMIEMLEPPYLFEDPDTPPRGNPWRDSWP